jgi:hypothetical protein
VKYEFTSRKFLRSLKSVDTSIGNYINKKNIHIFRAEFGLKNLYSRVISPSTGNLTYMKKIHALRDKKRENKPRAPKSA